MRLRKNSCMHHPALLCWLDLGSSDYSYGISNPRNELLCLCQTQCRHPPSQAARNVSFWKKPGHSTISFCCHSDGLTQPGAETQLGHGTTTPGPLPLPWSSHSPCSQPERKGVARHRARLGTCQCELHDLHMKFRTQDQPAVTPACSCTALGNGPLHST